jgi:hypothetical protein
MFSDIGDRERRKQAKTPKEGERKMKRTIAIAGGILGALGLVLATAAPALATTGPAVYSPEQAGYSATGNRFEVVDTTVKLPDPTQFAGTVTGFGLSVQLWSKTRVLVLGVSNSTAAPGDYSAAVAVYNRTTHALICSTASATARCPRVPTGWTSGKVSFPVGDTVELSIQYDRSLGVDFFDVFDHNVGIILDYGGYAPGTGKIYSQARAGAEFSAVSPWDGSPFVAPDTETHLATFTNSLLETYSGHFSGFSSNRFTHHKIIMTSNGTSVSLVEAKPHDLFNFGQNFGVYLEPKP